MKLFAAIILITLTLSLACKKIENSNSQPNITNNADNRAAGFNVSLSTEPSEIEPNQPVKLKFVIQDNNKRSLGTADLEIVHEKLMHLMIVSEDLSYFSHIHPEPKPDNNFIVETTFPAPGKYKVFLDYTPKGETTHQLGRLDLNVTGTPPPRVPLIADTEYNKVVDGVRVVMKSDKPLRVGDPLTLTFLLSDAESGSPIRDLQPYLGAFAHFVLINQDTTQYLHAHPLEEVTSPDMLGGPLVETQTVFPKAGLYKVWAQFQRNGKVVIAPFVATVGAAGPTAPAVIANNDGSTQSIKVTVSENGYEPKTLQLKRGLPAKITFLRVNNKNCGSEVIFRSLGIRKQLPVGQPVTIEFTPDKDGEYQFTCGMGMLNGAVIVVN